jgi:hypothetical protein
MDDLERLIRKLIREQKLHWALDGSRLTIHFGDHGRSQVVQLGRRGGDYVFTSRVLPAAQVTKTAKRWRQLAYRAWCRNAQSDLVTFGFDEEDRLVGRVVQPAETCDEAEVLLYVDTLAQECDEFEYVLTGGDAE